MGYPLLYQDVQQITQVVAEVANKMLLQQLIQVEQVVVEMVKDQELLRLMVQ